MARGPEAKIQDTVIRWARREYPPIKGVPQLVCRKNQAGPFGTNGYPDYEFNAVGPLTWFLEFKAPGKEPTPLQGEKIKELRAMGFAVAVIDNVKDGKRFIRDRMEKESL